MRQRAAAGGGGWGGAVGRGGALPCGSAGAACIITGRAGLLIVVWVHKSSRQPAPCMWKERQRRLGGAGESGAEEVSCTGVLHVMHCCQPAQVEEPAGTRLYCLPSRPTSTWPRCPAGAAAAAATTKCRSLVPGAISCARR